MKITADACLQLVNKIEVGQDDKYKLLVKFSNGLLGQKEMPVELNGKKPKIVFFAGESKYLELNNDKSNEEASWLTQIVATLSDSGDDIDKHMIVVEGKIQLETGDDNQQLIYSIKPKSLLVYL